MSYYIGSIETLGFTSLAQKEILGEVSQTQKDKLWYVVTYICILAVKSMVTNLQSIEQQRVDVE